MGLTRAPAVRAGQGFETADSPFVLVPLVPLLLNPARQDGERYTTRPRSTVGRVEEAVRGKRRLLFQFFLEELQVTFLLFFFSWFLYTLKMRKGGCQVVKDSVRISMGHLREFKPVKRSPH